VSVATSGPAVAKSSVTTEEQHVEWEPRPSEQSWWQTRQGREELAKRLLGLFTDRSEGRTRDTTRRRGLNKLLDWLECQPGDTEGSSSPMPSDPGCPRTSRRRYAVTPLWTQPWDTQPSTPRT
jgi:hypothetical protein